VLIIEKAWNKKIEKIEKREGYFCQNAPDLSWLLLFFLQTVFFFSPHMQPQAPKNTINFPQPSLYFSRSTFPKSLEASAVNFGEEQSAIIAVVVSYGGGLESRTYARIQACYPAFNHSSSSIDWGWIRSTGVNHNNKSVSRNLVKFGVCSHGFGHSSSRRSNS